MHPQLAVHRAIVVVDVERFGDPDRTNLNQLAVRDGLYKALIEAFGRSGIEWGSCVSEDRGDGALILVPPEVPKAYLVTSLPGMLAAAVSWHNAERAGPEQMRLRMALHAGEVYHDAHGVAGSAVNHAFRLAEAPALRSALAASPGVLAVIVSDWLFSEVIRHDPAAEPGSYRKVQVAVKETAAAGWIRTPDPGTIHDDASQDHVLPLWDGTATSLRDRQWLATEGLLRGGAVMDLPGLGLGLITAELDHLSDLFAGAVKDQWTRAATDRGLLQPDPIPVQWGKSSLPVAGPPSAAVGSQRFAPLPGLSAVGQQRLRGGRISDLHAVYGGLGSGRLVIAGAPGSGKSGAAVLLVLAALKHREQVPDADRPRVPVPVMFTLHGWDPRTQHVQEWLAARLQQTYPLLAGKSGARKAAELLAAGKVAVILDGLDEIHEELRPVALQALSQQAHFRLVVLTRSAEMAAAASQGLLEGAAALELQAIDPATAASYLTNTQLHPAPPGWRELTGRLRHAPDSPLAHALSSPLTLTLVRDTYRGGDDSRELLDFCDAPDRAVSSEDIVDHLLDRVVPAAYAERPGVPLRYDLQTAEHALRCLAARMNQDGTRDLQWWQVCGWAPSAPRNAATGLLFGLAVGLVGALAVRPTFGLVVGISAAVGFGLVARFRERAPSRIGPRPLRQAFRPASIPVALAVGLPTGLAVGLPVGLAAGLAGGLAAGLAFGLTMGFTFSHGPDNTAPHSPLTSWHGSRVVGLATGLAAGFTGGLAVGLAGGLEGSLAAALAGGLAAGLALSRTAVRAVGLAAGLSIGLAYGLAFGLLVGFTGGRAIGLTTGLTAGLAVGVTFGPAAGFMYSMTWPASLAFVQLAARQRTPIRLMRFLEDARDRNVLRTVGPVYQFRHARLQDRLATQHRLPDAQMRRPLRT